jgi:hypothetical protein
MADNDLSLRLDNRKTLWLTEISRNTFENQGINDLESDGGVFIVLEDESDGRFEVIAKAASFWAGESLLRLVGEFIGRVPEPA